MQYTKPLNETNSNAGYRDAVPAQGIKGSTVPALAIEAPQREIVNAIISAGLTPSAEDNTQLTQAIEAKISEAAAGKQDALVSGTNIKTLNNVSLLGSGNISVQATITGAATTITSSNLTANRALIANASGKVAASSVTSTELGYLSGVTSNIQTQLNGLVEPTGTIKSFAGSSIPSGWINCNGAEISRTTYATLFSVIGTTYGAGDGSTTFNVPNVKLVGGTMKVMGNGKSLGLNDGTNNIGVVGVSYMDVHLGANTGSYNINKGAATSNGTAVATGKGLGVVTSGESGLVLSPTQTVKAIIKY